MASDIGHIYAVTLGTTAENCGNAEEFSGMVCIVARADVRVRYADDKSRLGPALSEIVNCRAVQQRTIFGETMPLVAFLVSTTNCAWSTMAL